MNQPIIVGIDEAGRGALAGPVVAGACLLLSHQVPSFITDSKELSPAGREHAFEWIETHCTYGYGSAGPEIVDEFGILEATERAMHEALTMLEQVKKPTYVLVDGRDKFWFDYPHSSIIDGDLTEPCISAGSIVAKVTRDRMMTKLAEEYPQFDFELHKGYGTPQHLDALKAYGPCAIHRKTFLTRLDLPVSEEKTTESRRQRQPVS